MQIFKENQVPSFNVLSLKKIVSYQNRILFYILALILFNLFLFTLPLSNSLGYEFSLFNALFLSFVISIHAASILKKNFNSFYDHKSICISIAVSFFFFASTPLVLAVLKNLIIGGCPLYSGLYYYTVITLPSLFVGIGIGFFVFAISQRFWIYLLVIVYWLMYLIPVLELYFNPQVFFYNPLLGYVNAVIYDEVIPIDLKLITYRLLNILLFLVISALSYGYLFFRKLNKVRYGFNLSTIGYFISWFILTSIVILFYFNSSQFGYRTTSSNLKKELGGHFSTENFEIYYSNSIDKEKVKLSVLHAEYYYEELKQFFNVKPSKIITIFLFDKREQKKKLMGSANADVAKPWLYQVYINADNYNSSLKHELAHCFTAEFGWTIFKGAYLFNPSIIEGAAMAADPFYDENSLSKMAAVAYQNNYQIDISLLFSGLNFFGQHSSLSYIYSGAFCEYLIDNYGINNFKEYYQTLDYTNIYRELPEQLYKNFYEYLLKLETGENENKALYYFGRKSIFQRECPRYFAIKQFDAWGIYNDGNYVGALENFTQLYNEGSTYSSLIGKVNSNIQLKDYQTGLEFILKEKNKFEGTSYIFNIELLIGDLYVRNEEYENALIYYEKSDVNSPTQGFNNLTRLRKELSNNRLQLYNYIKGSSFDKYAILKEVTKNQYIKGSIPVMINLSKELKENYEFFLSLIKENADIIENVSSYDALKLAEYASENLDFQTAVDFSESALDINKDIFFTGYIEKSVKKYLWMLAQNKIVTIK